MKIKKDFWKCTNNNCNFQTVLKSEAKLHRENNLKIIHGEPTLQGHVVKNLRSK